MAKRKKKTPLPKPRRVWEIHPRTRVKKSKKIYERKREKGKQKSWTEELPWFQD